MPRIVLLLALVGLGATVTAAPAARPNLVLIMADDFGYECVSANGGESGSEPSCHFPATPVTYPAAFKRCANVTARRSMAPNST